MLATMSWAELLGWMAYAEEEPFGEERADLRGASIVAAIYNVNRDPKKTRPFQPSEFMPKFGRSGRGGSGGARKPLTDPKDWKRLSRTMAESAGMA